MSCGGVISPARTLFSAVAIGCKSPIDVATIFDGCACEASTILGFIVIVLVPPFWMGDFTLLMACVADLVTRGLLTGGLGCNWPSASPLRGCFWDLNDRFGDL